MAISAVITILFNQFGLPVVLGYILAGIVIGPYTPPFPLVRDLHSIHTLSELGVIFLLFSIGLEFSLSRLAKVGVVAFIAATLEIISMIWIGYSVGRLCGWNSMNSLFLGAILSISSTTIIAKILIEMKTLKEKFAQVILGILIIEDLLAIVIIAVLSGIASTGSLEVKAVLMATLKVFSFVAGLLLIGFLVVPRLMRYLSKFENTEMTVIAVLGLCFAVSLLTAKFGFSVALGAFLVGAIIAETKQVQDVVHKMEPLRDMFTAIFFVSVGMLIDPLMLAELWIPILVITIVTLIGKIFSCSFATFLTGYSGETALKVGLGLAQIGEFSFIIARLGQTANVTSPLLYPIAVAVSSITTLTTPFLMRNAAQIIRFLSWLTPQPVLTFLSLYTGWFEKMSGIQSEKKAALQNELKLYLIRLFLYAAGALSVFYAVAELRKRIPTSNETYLWILLGILELPLFMGFAYTLNHILWNVLFLNSAKSRDPMGQASEANRSLHKGFRFLMFIFIGLIFLFIGSFFLPRLPLTIAVVGLILISGLFLWDAMKKIHDRIEKTVVEIFGRAKYSEDPKRDIAHDELVRLIRKEYLWDVTTEDFFLPYKPSAVNQSIRDLRLRGETGASIVAIYRGKEPILNPPPETHLLPGDVLLLMGNQEQIKEAVQYLTRKIKEPPIPTLRKESAPKTQLFQISETCRAVGMTLGELRLGRKTGANVLGIQKGQQTLSNPSRDTVIEAGDVLILFGWSDQIEKAVQFLGRP